QRQQPALQQPVDGRLQELAHRRASPGQIILASAMSLGQTATGLPFCTWMTCIVLVRFWPCGVNFKGPKKVGSSSAASASRTLFASVVPAFSTASTRAMQAAVASAPWYSGARPPNAALNAVL